MPLFTGYSTIRVFLTSGTTYTVPDYWNNESNYVECIGAGGGGRTGVSGSSGGAGGGGGAYARANNIRLTQLSTE